MRLQEILLIESLGVITISDTEYDIEKIEYTVDINGSRHADIYLSWSAKDIHKKARNHIIWQKIKPDSTQMINTTGHPLMKIKVEMHYADSDFTFMYYTR